MPIASVVGLVVAIGGMALLASPAHRLLGDPTHLTTKLLEQAVLWLLLAVVLLIVLTWERRPLSSIGLQPPALRTLVVATLLTATVVWLVAPAAIWAVSRLGLPTLQSGLADFSQWPLWFKLLAIVTAGVVEETLFRGYALDRLGAALGSYGRAGLLTLIAFAALHWPLWGSGAVLIIFCTGATFTVCFVWQRDLSANILAHVLVDTVGLIIGPAMAQLR